MSGTACRRHWGCAPQPAPAPPGSYQRTGWPSRNFPCAVAAGATTTAPAAASAPAGWATARRLRIVRLPPARYKRNDTDGLLLPDHLPLSGVDTDWRHFRAHLVAAQMGHSQHAWVHPVPHPEKGCLLLAHPMLFTQEQEHFYHAVIFLLEHDDRKGSIGIILNRPTKFSLGEVSVTGQELSAFRDSPLFVGGDVGDELQLIHTVGGVKGSEEIVHGVYAGGAQDAAALVSGGLAPSDKFRWFLRYTGWNARQLESECRAGVWFTAAASPDVIARLPTDSHGLDFWHEVMQLMGGNHKALSDIIKEKEARSASL